MEFEIKALRKIVRPWGVEYQFSAYIAETGEYINDTVVIDSDTPDESPNEKIADVIQKRTEIDEVHLPSAEQSLSQVDEELISIKNELKVFGVTYMKMNPLCTEEEYSKAFVDTFGDANAGMAKKLLDIYITNAHKDGFTNEKSFNAFRDWVCATPVEILMNI